MKKMILMATMMVAAVAANAQYEAGTLSLGVRAGGTGSSLTDMPKLDRFDSNKDTDTQAIGGGILGLDLEYQFTSKFSISAGVAFDHAGSGWKDYTATVDGTKMDVKNVMLDMNYITVPVTANVYLWRGLAVRSGVQFGFLTSAKMKGEGSYSEDGWDMTHSFEKSVKNECNKFDIAIPIGLSYEFKNHIVLDARYNIGLLKINKESVEGYKDNYNRTLNLTIGYKFKL